MKEIAEASGWEAAPEATLNSARAICLNVVEGVSAWDGASEPLSVLDRVAVHEAFRAV